MSIYITLTMLIIGCALAACQFEPVYGTNGSAAGVRHNITIQSPESQQDFQLTRALEERLGRVSSGRYVLDYDLSLSRTGTGVVSLDQTTRVNILGNVSYNVIDQTTGDVVLSDTESNFTSYITSVSTVAERASSENAELRLMIILADLITTRLLTAQLPS